jgi:hypothetical protein
MGIHLCSRATEQSSLISVVEDGKDMGIVYATIQLTLPIIFLSVEHDLGVLVALKLLDLL